MFYYECFKCNHRTKQKIEMKRHFERKFKCTKNIESYKYSDNEIYDISITKKYSNNNNNILNENQSKHVDINIININPNQEDEIKSTIETEKNDEDINKYKCNKCNYTFKNKSNLNRHLKNNKCNIQSLTNITNNTLNQQNIININLKLIKPFDDEWDVSMIDNTLKNILVLSNMKYTKTLEQILNNDVNLNVIIEDESDTGIVYKNNTEKFKPMTLNDIIDKSMDKLHKQLQSFHSDLKESNYFDIKDEYLEDEKNMIEEKYNEFKKNKEIQLKVKEYITNIYNTKKNETLKIYQEILNNDNLIEGY